MDQFKNKNLSTQVTPSSPLFLTPLLKLILTKNMIITGKTQNRIEITEEALDDDFDFCPISISIFNFFQALTIVF